jgi:acyl carrier protein
MTAQVIAEWLAGYLSRSLAVSLEDIDAELPFDSYGIDSSKASLLVSDLGDWLERELELSVIYDHASIAELSEYLATSTE